MEIVQSGGVGCVGFVAFVRLFHVRRRNKQNSKKRKIEWRRKEKRKEKKKNTVRQIQLGYLELTVCVQVLQKKRILKT